MARYDAEVEAGGRVMEVFNLLRAKHKGMIIAIAKNNFFNEQIVFLGSSGVSYLSEDCGESFKLLDHGKKLFKIRFHPTRKNYLLARTEVDCEGKKNCTKRMELILTKDHVKWESLVDYVQDFDWFGTTLNAI